MLGLRWVGTVARARLACGRHAMATKQIRGNGHHMRYPFFALFHGALMLHLFRFFYFFVFYVCIFTFCIFCILHFTFCIVHFYLAPMSTKYTCQPTCKKPRVHPSLVPGLCFCHSFFTFCMCIVPRVPKAMPWFAVVVDAPLFVLHGQPSSIYAVTCFFHPRYVRVQMGHVNLDGRHWVHVARWASVTKVPHPQSPRRSLPLLCFMRPRL